jgi:hypothetical protein
VRDRAASGRVPTPRHPMRAACAVLSRGQADKEDATTRLVARFGHCSQELLNLCLCGAATPNVFDGCARVQPHSLPRTTHLFSCADAPLCALRCDSVRSDYGLEMRGVEAKSVVGYLTQLESMRYTEVGVTGATSPPSCRRLQSRSGALGRAGGLPLQDAAVPHLGGRQSVALHSSVFEGLCVQ